MFTRRTWPDPGGSNLSLDVQRSRGCGYELRGLLGFVKTGRRLSVTRCFLSVYALAISLYPVFQ